MSLHQHSLIKSKDWTRWCFGLFDNIYICTKCSQEFELTPFKDKNGDSNDE